MTKLGVVDTVDGTKLTRIGFGSCNNQLKGPQDEVFNTLTAKSFDLWIWGGDVVYAKGLDLKALEAAYDQLKKEGSYFKFAQSVERVVGTWDDHDLGVNDGGSETPDLDKRRDLFWDFLNVPQDSPRRQRKGVYSSHEFGSGNETVRVILLDTRSGRSNYAISSLGRMGAGTPFSKLFPLLAAAVRTFMGLTGFTEYLSALGLSNDRMLDDVQWRWLEAQLSSSTATVNLLVSSVQILTHNPSVESWGHFPQERRRLLRLINRTKPKGFLALSGDVHIGIASSPTAKDGFPLFEITSSGLTHTCTAGGVPKFVCTLVWNLFEEPARRDTMILSRNFGQIDIDWEAQAFRVKLESMTEPNEVSTFDRNFDVLPEFDADVVRGITPPGSLLILGGTCVFLLLVLSSVLRMVWSRCSSTKAK